MLDRNDLNKFGPPSFHLYQKEKDYLQHWILSFISQSGFEGVFKGGTCLQKAFNLSRFSEDLDFTLNYSLEPDMDSLVAFLSAAGFSGIIWKREEKEISSKIKIRFRGPLYNGTTISESTVILEFSKREKTSLESKPIIITPPYPDILPYQIKTMQKEEIAAEKIRAILSRNSARDLFDLYFLLHRKTKIDEKLTNEKLEYYGSKFNFSKFETKLKKLKQIWKKEVSALSTAPIDYYMVAKIVLKELKKIK